MASLNYEEVFANFLGNITDPTLIAQEMSDAYQLMAEYLHKALAKAHTRKLFSSVSLDDEIQVITYEMKTSVDDESDKEFIIQVLAKGMVVEWLQPQIKSKLNVAQYFGGKEQQFFSQANHISELRSMLEDTQIELNKMIRDRAYYFNSYLNTES